MTYSYATPAPRRNYAVSDAQVNYLNSLVSRKAVPASILTLAQSVTVGEIKGLEVSQAIDTAKACGWKVSSVKSPVASNLPTETVPVGFYFLDAEVYKVKASKGDKTRRYAYIFKTDGTSKGHFDYTKGAIFRLTPEHKLTLAQAASIGHRTGVCCICGRELTDSNSVAKGIGPICEGKYF